MSTSERTREIELNRRRRRNSLKKPPRFLGLAQVMRWPRPLADGVSTRSTSPVTSTAAVSIIAFSANDAPVSRWHQVQWQACTKSGLPVMR